MNTKLAAIAERISVGMTDALSRLQRIQQFDKDHSDFVDTITCEVSVMSEYIDFDNPTREETMAVLQHFPDAWTKEVFGDKVTYTSKSKHSGSYIRCYNAPPPPNCKIIEEKVWVPPAEGHYTTKKKLQCLEDQTPAE